VVEKDTEGMTFDKQEDKIALRVVQNAEIHLHDVRVPEANRLQKAENFRATANVLRVTRMSVAWQATGCARGAFEHALRYTKARQQFGRPIASFQLVQDLLVKMLSNVTASTAMNVRASQLQDAGELRDEHASLCKAHATVRMREAVGWAREVLGGNGILLEHHVGRFVADAEAIYSYEGTREINDVDPLRTEGDQTLDLRLLVAVGRRSDVQVQPVLAELRVHRRAAPRDLRPAVR
jgi:glutaryl-CoA dehydrogenase